MKKYILKKKIYAVVFMLTVFGFAGVNAVHSMGKLMDTVQNTEEVKVSDIETAITDNLYGKMNFIETYAYVQVLLDKREYNNFSTIKDEEGFLHYASFFREADDDIFEYAMRVKRLQDYVSVKGTEVLFVIGPSKYIPGETVFRKGLPVNDPSDIVTELAFDLNRLGVHTLNLGETIPGESIPYEEAFFRTDHHWTIPAAFCATQQLVQTMNETFALNLDPEGIYTDINSYHAETYYGGMFGYLGRKTGGGFAGIDDFVSLWPVFEGDFDRECMTEEGKVEKFSGSFEEALMNEKALLGKTDLYSGSQYALYLNELRDYEKIINNEKPDGKKILMIRDSYFSPVIAFMMPMVGEIDAIWSLTESKLIDIETYVKNNDFDYIIIEVYPYNIHDTAFHYFQGEETE